MITVDLPQNQEALKQLKGLLEKKAARQIRSFAREALDRGLERLSGFHPSEEAVKRHPPLADVGKLRQGLREAIRYRIIREGGSTSLKMVLDRTAMLTYGITQRLLTALEVGDTTMPAIGLFGAIAMELQGCEAKV